MQTSPTSVSSGGTGLSVASAAYAVLVGGTNSIAPIQMVAPGTSGQVFTSNGAGALPSWTKNNGFVLLKTIAASNSANLTFNSSDFSSDFSVFMIIIEGLDPLGVGVTLQGTFSTNNGSSYLSTGYSSGMGSLTYNGTAISSLNSTTVLQLCTTSSGQHSAIFFLFGMNGNFPTSTGPVIIGWSFSAFVPTRYGILIGSISGSPNVNNLRIAESSGNINTGYAFLYGLVT